MTQSAAGDNGKERQIGFFPLTADPIHYGHLYGAMEVLNALKLSCVYIQIAGDLPDHKPDKTAKHHRHTMAKLAIFEFYPRLRYTPLGFDNPLIGEELFVQFMRDPEFSNVSCFFYLTGADNESIVRRRFKENEQLSNFNYRVVVLARSGFKSGSDSIVVPCHTAHSSSSFRLHQQSDFVPEVVRRYCWEHGLYGY